MPLSSLRSLPGQLGLPTVKRAQHWWRHLTPQRQDRLAVLAPLLAVVLFFAAIVAALAYLQLEEIDREQQAVQRDVEYTQQRLRLRLLERQEQFMRMARELANRDLSLQEFKSRVDSMFNQYPELQGVAWLDDRRRIRFSQGSAVVAANLIHEGNEALHRRDRQSGFTQAHELNQPVYAQRTRSSDDATLLQLHIPMNERERFSGVILVEYSIDGLFRYGVPSEVSARYAVSLLGENGAVLAGTAIPTKKTVTRLIPWSSPPTNTPCRYHWSGVVWWCGRRPTARRWGSLAAACSGWSAP